MQRDKYQLECSLERKGFQKQERHHHFFIYFTIDGKKTNIRTKTSHTQKRKTIGNPLLKEISRQCCLTKSQFLDLIDCPLNREQYEKILIENKIL